MIRLSLLSVGMVEETASVVLVLRAPEQGRLLVMEVGVLEGRAIAIEAEEVKTPRPLTHELTHKVIAALDASLDRVLVREFTDKTFFADLILKRADGTELAIDCRPSDAIALALRAGAGIYATPEVLAAAGIDEEESVEDEAEETETDEDDEEEGVLH